MSDATGRRVGGVAGIVFGILVLLAFGILGEAPDFVDDPAEIAEFFSDGEGKLLGSGVIAMLAAFALGWFGSTLRDALRRDDGGPGPGVIAIGTAVAAASYALAGGFLVVGAERASEQGDAGAASSFLNWDLFQVTYGGGAPIGLAIMLTGVAASALGRRTFIPVWLAWVSIALGVLGLIVPIAWALTFGIAVWSVIVGLLMLRRT